MLAALFTLLAADGLRLEGTGAEREVLLTLRPNQATGFRWTPP